MKAYLKTGKNARQQEKYSAGFQVPLSFLRDSTRIREKRTRKPEHRHTRMSKKALHLVGVIVAEPQKSLLRRAGAKAPLPGHSAHNGRFGSRGCSHCRAICFSTNSTAWALSDSTGHLLWTLVYVKDHEAFALQSSPGQIAGVTPLPNRGERPLASRAGECQDCSIRPV